MGIFKFVMDKGKDLLDQKDEPAEAIRKEVEDLGLGDGLGGDFRVMVEGDRVKLEGETPSQEVKEKIILAAGNVSGIAEVEEDLKVPETVFYEVKSGDTLSKIAKAHYGNASKYPVIFEANKPMLKDPDLIYPGQKLRIPGAGAKA
ncbi:MAG: peptidoglycan-binding protein LysM [Pseudomonadota bacterium]